MVERMSGAFGERMAEMLRQTREHEPAFSPDGRQAMFRWDQGRIKLRKDDQDRWQFNL